MAQPQPVEHPVYSEYEDRVLTDLLTGRTGRLSVGAHHGCSVSSVVRVSMFITFTMERRYAWADMELGSMGIVPLHRQGMSFWDATGMDIRASLTLVVVCSERGWLKPGCAFSTPWSLVMAWRLCGSVSGKNGSGWMVMF